MHIVTQKAIVWETKTLSWKKNILKNLLLKVERSMLRITKTGLFKYIENFTTKKGKKSDIFLISAQVLLHRIGV